MLFTLLFFISCNGKQNKSSENTQNDSILVKKLTIQWNDYLMKQDIKGLNSLYAEETSLYGESLSKKEVILNKENFFKKYPDFNQSINGEIIISKVSENQYKATFQKHVSYNSKTIDVQAYLYFNNINDNWVITNESDNLTDKNISRRYDKKTCIDVVTEILTTSPLYLKYTDGLYEAIVKNGGTSYGTAIEGSPNPEKDKAWYYSETYDFNLHEIYPDRMPTIARFTFDPANMQLYEDDIIKGELVPIEFDKSLLLKFKELCK